MSVVAAVVVELLKLQHVEFGLVDVFVALMFVAEDLVQEQPMVEVAAACCCECCCCC